MKFGRQLEEYQLPEWKGQYFPYTVLKKRLATLNSELLEISTPLSVPSRSMWFGVTVPQEPSTPPLISPVDAWWHTVKEEALRVGACVDYGFQGLQLQLEDVIEMSSLHGSASSNVGVEKAIQNKQEKYFEIRIIEALSRVSEALVRLRGFAELNHAALYKILKKHDKILKSTYGLQVLLPDLVNITGLGTFSSRLDQLDSDIKTQFKQLGQEQGMMSPEVLRYSSGLGTMGRSNMLNTKDSRDHWHQQLLCFFLGASLMSYFFLAVFIFLPPREHASFSVAYFLCNFAVFRVPLSVMLVVWGMGFVSRMCENASINHMFLLGVDPRCHVQDKFLFGMAAMLNTAWVFIFGLYVVDYKWMVVLEHIAVNPGMWTGNGYNKRSSWHFVLYPVLLVIVVSFIVLRRSIVCRFRFKLGLLKSVGRCLMAPFVAVSFGDNVTGDVLTSLAKPLQDIPIAWCYLFSAHPETEANIDNFSHSGNLCPAWVVPTLLPAIAGLPYWLRLMQCLRRYRDSGDTRNLWNFGKYFVSLMVVVVSALTTNLYAVAFISMSATIYCSYWDVFIDWGLTLQDLVLFTCQWAEGSRFPRLAASSSRDQLTLEPDRVPMPISQKLGEFFDSSKLRRERSASKEDKPQRMFSPQFYATASVIDFFARCSWVCTLIPSHILSHDIVVRALLTVFLSALEIARRSVWAVLRMEHEQLSNASGFRALLWVPMKMNQEEDFLNIRLKVKANTDGSDGPAVVETVVEPTGQITPPSNLLDAAREPLLGGKEKEKKEKKDKKEKKKKDDDSDSD